MRYLTATIVLSGFLLVLPLTGCGSSSSESGEHRRESESGEHRRESESGEHRRESESGEHSEGAESSEGGERSSRWVIHSTMSAPALD